MPILFLQLSHSIGCGFGYYNIGTGGTGIRTGIGTDFSILSAKYFFTDLIGIEATVFNSFAFMYDFKNTFVFKVEPVFRFGAKWKEALAEEIKNNHLIYDMYYAVLARICEQLSIHICN